MKNVSANLKRTASYAEYNERITLCVLKKAPQSQID
jgi:hypothetical protein